VKKETAKFVGFQSALHLTFKFQVNYYFPEILILICRKKWKRSQGKVFGPKKLGGFGASP
jgi:hypothetical protein